MEENKCPGESLEYILRIACGMSFKDASTEPNMDDAKKLADFLIRAGKEYTAWEVYGELVKKHAESQTAVSEVLNYGYGKNENEIMNYLRSHVRGCELCLINYKSILDDFWDSIQEFIQEIGEKIDEYPVLKDQSKTREDFIKARDNGLLGIFHH
ncbi:Uncharacterised protein [uncultured archaeon]|nr:Uncharacterised protein [uncultured archaeon]